MIDDQPALRGLTARQIEVLGCVRCDLSYKQIAAALRMSEHTARVHVNAIASRIPPRPGFTAYRLVRAWAGERSVA